MKKISFVIPCYRSEKTIPLVVGEIKNLFSQRSDVEYEIIMVVDHSPDNVYAVIRNLCLEDPHLRGIELASNFGQHSALMCGYSYVSGDVVVSLDDDGQAPVESVFDLLQPLEEGEDVVFGEYMHREGDLLRRVGSAINERMSCWLLNKPKQLKTNSFFSAKKFVIDEILKYDKSYPYLAGLILRTTSNIVNVPVNHRAREVGRSGYTVGKLLRLWINGFTAFSVKPLRLATLTGFLFAVFGFILGMCVIIKKIYNPEISAGYSSIMAILVFVGGVLMLMLGLIGEYVGRIYICINKSPQYVIRDSTDKRN